MTNQTEIFLEFTEDVIDLLEGADTGLSGREWDKGGSYRRVYVTHHGRDRGYLEYFDDLEEMGLDEETWVSHVTGGARTLVNAALDTVRNYEGN